MEGKANRVEIKGSVDFLALPKVLLCFIEAACVLLFVYFCVKFKLLGLEKCDTLYVLVLSYPRSGSTFLGDILAADQHAVFLFEPDLVLQDLMKKNNTDSLHYLTKDPFCIPDSQHDLQLNMSNIQVLKSVFISKVVRCFDEDSLKILLDHKAPIIRHRSANSRIWRQVRQLPKAKELFRKSRYIVMKTIRFSMADVQPLLEIFDRVYKAPLHIVHLVRDPRARALSLKSKLRKWSKRARDVRRQCALLRQNIKEGESLPSDRYHLIRYEDLTFNPVGETKKLYKSLGIRWHDGIKRHIGDLVYKEMLDFPPDHNMSSYFSTFRESYCSPNRWRWILQPKEIKYIDDACAEIMPTLGYKAYSPEDDLARSLVLVMASSSSHSLLLSEMISQHPDASLFFEPDQLLPASYDHHHTMDILKCHPDIIKTIWNRQNELQEDDIDPHHKTTIRKLGRTGWPFVPGLGPELPAMCLASQFRILSVRPSSLASGWRSDNDDRLRIVHLVHDAANVFAEVSGRSDVMPRARKTCEETKNDLSEDNRLHRHYRIVCQDDLVSQPRTTARSLYKWLEIPWPDKKMEAFFAEQPMLETQEE